MPRPRCSVYIAVSLDGFIARRDGGLDFLGDVQLDGEDYGYAAFLASVDTLIVGRGTWEVVRTFPSWPWEGKRVIVLTNRPATAVRDEIFAAGALAPILAGLHAGGARHVYVDGGAVVRQALAEGAVDELTLSIVPRLLGDGLPLFGAGVPEVRLRCLGSRAWEASGLVQLRYEAER